MMISFPNYVNDTGSLTLLPEGKLKKVADLHPFLMKSSQITKRMVSRSRTTPFLGGLHSLIGHEAGLISCQRWRESCGGALLSAAPYANSFSFCDTHHLNYDFFAI